MLKYWFVPAHPDVTYTQEEAKKERDRINDFIVSLIQEFKEKMRSLHPGFHNGYWDSTIQIDETDGIDSYVAVHRNLDSEKTMIFTIGISHQKGSVGAICPEVTFKQVTRLPVLFGSSEHHCEAKYQLLKSEEHWSDEPKEPFIDWITNFESTVWEFGTPENTI